MQAPIVLDSLRSDGWCSGYLKLFIQIHHPYLGSLASAGRHVLAAKGEAKQMCHVSYLPSPHIGTPVPRHVDPEWTDSLLFVIVRIQGACVSVIQATL